MAPHIQRPGIARACAECHKRKIRCDVQENGQSCSNCKLYETACQLRARKRRRTNQGSTVVDTAETTEGADEALPRRLSKPKSESHHRLPSPVADSSLSSPAVGTTEDNADGKDVDDDQAPRAIAYLDFSDYYGQHAYLKGKVDQKPKSRLVALSEADKEILRLQRAFDLPPKPLLDSLIDSFMKHCFPWVPVFDQRWLWDGKEDGSPALTKAVLVAGARTSDTALSCQEYYSAAKSLLLYGHENNPIVIIVSCLLLAWWNQTSPDIVSLDNSTSWIRQAVGVAYQIDLHKEPRNTHGASYRRRLWWTLVARDSQLSASHGRPRYINLAICHVRPLCLDDLVDKSNDSRVFMAYVKASIILGDLAESCQQGTVTPSRFAELRNALFWWLKDLPSTITSFDPGMQASVENFNMRQVYVLFLSTVAILYRSIRNGKTPSAIELIASSFIVGLFEDFYDRGELRRLSAGFNFYPVVAAIPQLEAVGFHYLYNCIQSDIGVIEDSLQDLGQRWPSARRGLRLLEKVRQASSNAEESTVSATPNPPDLSDLLLFETFDRAKCRVWRPLMEQQDGIDGSTKQHQVSGGNPSEDDRIPYMAIPTSGMDETAPSNSNHEFDPAATMAYDDLAFWLPDASFNQDIFGGWLLNDDAFGTNLNL